MLIATTLLSATILQAQSVDEIVDKYIETRGGKEKMLSLKTVRMEGNMSVLGVIETLVVTKSHMIGTRVDIGIDGTNNYQVVTPDKSTMYMPSRGMTAPGDMPEDQIKAARIQLDLQGVLLNYKDKGTKISLLGKEKINDDDTYDLELTFLNGYIFHYYISTTSYRLVKSRNYLDVNGQNIAIDTYFEDWKPNADGYWFPYTARNIQGATTFNKIETNIPIDPTIFK